MKWIEAQLDANPQETMVETRLADNPAAQLGATRTMYDLGKVYARGRHAYGLIPPRGALQGFDCVKPSGSLDAQISLEGPSRTVIAVGRIITAADIALLYKRGCAEYERPRLSPPKYFA